MGDVLGVKCDVVFMSYFEVRLYIIVCGVLVRDTMSGCLMNIGR